MKCHKFMDFWHQFVGMDWCQSDLDCSRGKYELTDHPSLASVVAPNTTSHTANLTYTIWAIIEFSNR